MLPSPSEAGSIVEMSPLDRSWSQYVSAKSGHEKHTTAPSMSRVYAHRRERERERATVLAALTLAADDDRRHAVARILNLQIH